VVEKERESKSIKDSNQAMKTFPGAQTPGILDVETPPP
jgi:hypothetical protein